MKCAIQDALDCVLPSCDVFCRLLKVETTIDNAYTQHLNGEPLGKRPVGRQRKCEDNIKMGLLDRGCEVKGSCPMASFHTDGDVSSQSAATVLDVSL
jgi:hypothetical protein